MKNQHSASSHEQTPSDFSGRVRIPTVWNFPDLELILSLYSLLEIVLSEAWDPSTDDEDITNIGTVPIDHPER